MNVDPVVHCALTLCLALLWSSSAWDKLQAPTSFAAALGGYQLLPTALLALTSRSLPWLELAIAAALLAPNSRSAAAALGALLMLIYSLAMAINLVRGRDDIDCGCSPGHHQRISWLLVIRNTVLCATSLALVLPVAARATDWIDTLLVLSATAIGCSVYLLVFSILQDRHSSEHELD